LKIYCMSDIHGCFDEFREALSLFQEKLEKPDTKLVLLGDYVHGGSGGREVLDCIMYLQDKYGAEKIIALVGNHDEWVIDGSATIDCMTNTYEDSSNDGDEDKYVNWLCTLPRYYVEGKTIFVHAGIDEEAGDLWEWTTNEEMYTMKFPAEIGSIHGLDKKIVAGHVGTSKLARDYRYHDIYYDGGSHYYIDGTVLVSRKIPVLMVDTDTDKYYRVTETGNWLILPYDEEN